MSRSSLNSKRSNNCNNSNNKKRKKDGQQQQQTLVGMAWGSNSNSSSAFRSSPFSNFGSYMEVKNRKLHEQFDAEASCSSHGGSGSEKPVFYGVSIFVDGYTVPSSQELRGYMLKHGGRFENYFSRQRVTHIICSNLPNSKVKNLRSFSRGLPVVKPTWVLDSVAAKKLLNWVPYQLDQIASEANNQPKLSAFLGLRSSLIPGDHADVAVTSDVDISEVSDSAEDVRQLNQESEYYVRDSLDEPEVEEQVNQPNQESEYYVRDSLDEPEAEEQVNQPNHESEYYVRDSLDEPEAEEQVNQPNQESEYYVRDSLDGSEIEEPTCSNNCEKEASTTNDVLINEMQSERSPCQPSVSEGSRCSDIQHVTETLSVVPNSSNRGHSASSEPNFVETYFKNSRLHFIGTWKQRYRKRFPRSSDVLRPSSSISPSSTCQSKTIIHIDLDCFFVSVVIRNRPELWDKPVAVCHSDNPRGTSEISSANYPARDHGVRAGIFVRDAKALCPHLVIVPYNFEAYEEVADQFYSILHKHCNKVQAMSCDEAVLDITDLEVNDPQHLASLIRKEIFDTTGCTASVGISSNMLMARLATRSAKPDGQRYLPLDKVDDFMEELPVKALPGIGRALEEKLKGRHVKTCGELRIISKESLQKDFGHKTGEMLWNHCRGIDNHLVGTIQETKSVGADVNWGVRFKDMNDCQHFLLSLCKEVSLRLHGCGVSGRTFTLKIKKRKTDEEPVKYMGCGDCDNLSHSLTVPMATDDVDVLQRITKQLFSHFHIDVEDIRGVGLHVTKLECADNCKQGSERRSIRSWLVSASAPKDKDTKEQFRDQLHQAKSKTVGATTSNQEANQSSGLPSSPSGFDPDYLKSLPPEIFSEYNEFYGGKLTNYILRHTSESIDVGTSSVLPGDTHGVRAQLEPVIPNNVAAASTSQNVGDVGVMPSSLSQIDASALQEYPQEIRDEILKNLPAHRNPETIPDALPQGLNLNHLEIQAKPTDHDSNNALWSGNPPHWVQIYKSSDSQILRYLSDIYSGLKSNYDLSSVLLKSVAATEVVCVGRNTTECDDAIRCLCELLQQYIELKVESDLEEIHACFRILRRLSVKSELFLQVYNTTIPHLQMTVSEKYGGTLCI